MINLTQITTPVVRGDLAKHVAKHAQPPVAADTTPAAVLKPQPKLMEKKTTIELPRDKECKGSVRFATADDNVPVTNVYVSRGLEGVNNAHAVRITIELVP